MLDYREYSIYLPSKKDEWISHNESIKSECNSLFIVGANGSGKTRLGIWIEENNKKVHRISAQKSLNFNNNITVKNNEIATNLLLYGTEINISETSRYDKKHNVTIQKTKRWKSKNKNATSATVLLNDYDYALSAFISKINDDKEKYNRYRDTIELSKNTKRLFSDDVLYNIWEKVFPQRDIRLDNYQVVASYQVDDIRQEKYAGNEMSDGERVALYFLVQVLSLPENTKIIIDEPEIHLHPSIMNKLWSALEEARQDCLFIFITHDMDFVASHQLSTKIWVKSFCGNNNWDWEEIKKDDIPEELKLKILGNRRPILFIEGNKNSYDYEIYSLIYKNYYIVPCGSCEEVCKYTKAFNNSNFLHNYKCYGILDRDYRPDKEVANLNKSNVFVLLVAEIENLFLVPELLEVVNEIRGFKDNNRIDEFKNYIINERFLKEIDKQILNALVKRIEFRIKTLDVSGKTPEDIKSKIDGSNKFIDFDNTKYNIERLYKDSLEKKDYKGIIKIYNQKNLCNSNKINNLFELENESYIQFIFRQLRSENKDKLLEAIMLYLPTNEQIPYKDKS